MEIKGVYKVVIEVGQDTRKENLRESLKQVLQSRHQGLGLGNQQSKMIQERSNRSGGQMGRFIVVANNHPEVIISAGFHGGFVFFSQESCVEQMLPGLFQRSNASMSWMRSSFPMSVVTTVFDLMIHLDIIGSTDTVGSLFLFKPSKCFFPCFFSG